ncbi:glycosyltransferase family 2 protein [Phenylobacterium sp.]|uniref:glycosyltransferase family 2 protein n=1 Tax=Phenylobacterium sp. TaxID=1871053 RepID=UPI00286BDE35|nr:glycosyltransferase family 2 protein [Phenylobacterium sp.]
MADGVTEPDLVTVVLPTYNRARTLPRAIASVLNQDYRNLELLIVDDASSDDTAQVVAAISDPRVRYLPLPRNGGASHARNAGLAQARGAFIAFQDSDDEWLAGKLEKQVAAALAAGDPAVTVFHPKIVLGKDEHARYGRHRVCCMPAIAPGDRDFIRLIHESNLISPQALLISREAFNRAGFFDEDLVNNEDWAYGIELFYKTKVVFIEDPLVMNYLQPDSISMLRRRGARAQLRVIQKLRKYPEARAPTIAGHAARIGWSIAKLGYPGRGRTLLLHSLRLDGRPWRTWAQLVVTQAKIWRAALAAAARA